MATYRYTIFDADPDQSGPCEWPGMTDVEIKAESAAVAAEIALMVACIEAQMLPTEYFATDRLWVLVTDEDHCTHKFSREVG